MKTSIKYLQVKCFFETDLLDLGQRLRVIACQYQGKYAVGGHIVPNPRISLTLLLASSLTIAPACAMECTVCHSKNPKMVTMHEATNNLSISCFDCHRIGEKLMGKSQPKDRDTLLKRRVSAPECKICHNS